MGGVFYWPRIKILAMQITLPAETKHFNST